MIRVAIVGITGRMGSEIAALAPEAGFSVAAGVAPSSKGSSVPIVKDVDKLSPSEIDLVIDFSLPEAFDKVVGWSVKNKRPLVSGVTGISDEQKTLLKKAGEKIPVLWSPNMSLGVAVLGRALRALSALEGFDYQIEELHHKKKKDRPSGTALFLQERLKEVIKEKPPEPVSIRGGGIFGIHRVLAMGEEEVISLEHTAMNRRVFARGALRAAAWLKNQPPGLYTMDNVLGD